MLVAKLPNLNRNGLQSLLDNSNSLYRDGEGYSGLAEVAPSAVVDQVKQAVADAGQATSQHLTATWNAAYGYDNHTVHAFDEATRAVEATLRPIIKDDETIFRNIVTRPGTRRSVPSS